MKMEREDDARQAPEEEVKPGSTGSEELSDEELAGAAGGKGLSGSGKGLQGACCTGEHFKEAVITAR